MTEELVRALHRRSGHRGGGDAIAAASGAPFRSLLTIDEIYPDRPDRAG
jgi:hypothetical protein